MLGRIPKKTERTQFVGSQKINYIKILYTGDSFSCFEQYIIVIYLNLILKGAIS